MDGATVGNVFCINTVLVGCAVLVEETAMKGVTFGGVSAIVGVV